MLSYHNQAQRAGKMGHEALQDLRNIGGMELEFLKAMRAKLYEGENLSNTEKTARWKTLEIGSCIQSILGSIF